MSLLDSYVDVYATAERLRIHDESVRRLIRQGKLPAVKFENKWLIEKHVLEQFANGYEPLKGRTVQGGLF